MRMSARGRERSAASLLFYHTVEDSNLVSEHTNPFGRQRIAASCRYRDADINSFGRSPHSRSLLIYERFHISRQRQREGGDSVTFTIRCFQGVLPRSGGGSGGRSGTGIVDG